MKCLQGTVRRRRFRGRTCGAAAMLEIFMFALLFAMFLAAFSHWAHERAIRLSTIRTIDGFQILMEGTLGYRLENPGTWTDDFTLIDDIVPQLVVQDSRNGGVNGDGAPFQFDLTLGQLTIETTVVNESVARSVVYELGSAASYFTATDGYFIRVAVPTLEDIAALDPTLLTDGTHALHRSLWISSTNAQGGSCAGKGVAVNAQGELMSCDGGTWKLLSQHL